MTLNQQLGERGTTRCPKQHNHQEFSRYESDVSLSGRVMRTESATTEVLHSYNNRGVYK